MAHPVSCEIIIADPQLLKPTAHENGRLSDRAAHSKLLASRSAEQRKGFTLTKAQRIYLFIVSGVLLFIIFKLTTGSSFPTSDQSIVLFSTLLLMAFATLFLEKFFTAPSDVLSSNIFGYFCSSRLCTPNSLVLGSGTGYSSPHNLILLACSPTALLLLDPNRSPGELQNRLSRLLKRFATSFGNGRFLYCALFLLTLLFYVDAQSHEFFALSMLCRIYHLG